MLFAIYHNLRTATAACHLCSVLTVTGFVGSNKLISKKVEVTIYSALLVPCGSTNLMFPWLNCIFL